MQAGHCVHPEALARRGAGLCPVPFPALTGLILHPEEGPVLFDTGYDQAFFEATRPFPERLYRWTTPVTLPPGAAVTDQLKRRGVQPEEVRGIVLSHFHGDHVAGLHAFPQATIFCARAGLEDLHRHGRLGRVRRGLLSALVPEDIARRAVFFEDLTRRPLPSAYAPFEAGADLFGDGSLMAVELPGHCPGHWGLALNTPEGEALFVGDAAWSLKAVRENAPPPALSTALLGATEPYRRTLSDLNRLWARNPHLRLIPSHCREVAADVA